MELYTQYQDIFEEYGIQSWKDLPKQWQEPHRHFHTEEHLSNLIEDIEHLYQHQNVSEEDRKVLLLTAFYHDAIYDPTRTDNEESSAEYFGQVADSHPRTDHVKSIILDTKNHQPSGELSSLFCHLDLKIVRESNFSRLMIWEKQIFREYQYLDYPVYKKNRLAFLEGMQKRFPENTQNLSYLIEYLKVYCPKIGVYPGSFNPFHNGHLNILQKAENIFDKVIIARGINPDKEDIATDQLQLAVLKYRQTENFSGFLTNYLTNKEVDAEITLIRGLRNGDDLDYEVNQLRFMQEMKPGVKVTFIPSDKEFEHISSSSIKNLSKIDPAFSKRYIPH